MNSLTPRQLEIIALSASGYTGADISQEIYLSLHTVRNYIKAAKKRTGAKNLSQMVALCIRDELLVVDDDGTVKVNEQS